jgi:hypothetical protein
MLKGANNFWRTAQNAFVNQEVYINNNKNFWLQDPSLAEALAEALAISFPEPAILGMEREALG